MALILKKPFAILSRRSLRGCQFIININQDMLILHYAEKSSACDSGAIKIILRRFDENSAEHRQNMQEHHLMMQMIKELGEEQDRLKKAK
ncbi:MAG TPA: hypothetical protein DHD79_06775 [Firmicutes bacterium]|nr:hypothetical protein [Bacillota bacterium]HCX70933.1 hypothetical protein [Bacillota bacterium]